jgi:hypothetical protein
MEGSQYLADEAYESVTGQGKPHHGLRTPADPSGEAWDEDTVNALYPKLAAKFAG